MTNVDKLFALFGSMRQLAEAIGYDETGLSRWNKTTGRGYKGRVPVRYNRAIMDAADDLGIGAEVRELLEWKCPCCGLDTNAGGMAVNPDFWMPRRIKT